MAEFKLGRIRFVWKNNWSSGTTYYQDDVIAYGGKIYICVIGHTADVDFFNDLDINPPKWNLMSDGFQWKGSWQTGTAYIYNDIVEYGGRLYICNTVHTSASDSSDGLEVDQAKWTIFAEGLDWKGDWTTDTRYIVNDFVKYGGQTFVCITPHTSASTVADGLEADSSYWQLFNAGTEYKSTWTESTRYKVNDVVRYGAVLWICTTGHTSTNIFANDVANWEQYVGGFQFEAEWDPYATYQPGDVVRYGGNQFIAKTNHTEKNPSVELNDWDLFLEGINYKGIWADDSANQDYRVGDVVTHGAYTYICIADNNNQEPPNTTYWQQLTAGLQWRGEWLDDQQYYLGDIVRYSNNTYVCILGHWSEGDDFSTIQTQPGGGGNENSRPDLDVTGTYWNVISSGSEASVLTTKGDLVYYNGSGPVRLPIGANGQVLTVSADSIPEWAYLGDADDVYYVAEHGVDSPAPDYGRTIDRPWRSIRYATEQVEYGTKNPFARELLELNRIFIQRETTEWIEWQIANAGVGSIWENFTYDSVICERDTGFIVDALVWDITHGGNVRSREAALSYFEASASVTLNSQAEQDVAAFNYMLTLVENVLNQEAPAVNYQTTNGDNSTATVDQYFNTLITAESGVYTTITGLVGIITDAITAGVTTDIPERVIKNTLIKVSTGKYYEVLPINVPAECCILGDELRSTQVFPRKSSNGLLTPREDVQYSIKSVERIEEIIGDIVTGVTVTPSTGNTLTQDTSWPVAESEEVIAVEQLARTLRRNIDHAIGDKNEWTYPLAGELTDPYYGYARDLILANKEFLKAEIIGYLADQYGDLKYSRTSCSRDVGLILDAIAYDLTYGGNWQSVNAGLAYYAGASGSFVIDSTEKTATLAAYEYLKGLVETVGQNLTVTPVLNSEGITQVSGTAGSSTATDDAKALLDNIKSIITSGTSAVSITYPSITGASVNLQTDSGLLNSAKADVQTAVIDFINTNFGSFTYDAATCRRDAGLLKTGAAYDIGLGTNYNAIRDGLAYRRGMTAEVIASQLSQTVGAIQYEGNIVGDLLADATAISRNTAYWAEVIDILANGEAHADSITWTTGAGVAAKTTARTELQSNRASIISDLTSWIGSTYPGLAYNIATCERDTGYIIDAISYDIQYGGNSASYEAARAYYDGAVQILPAAQRVETAAAFTQLKTIVTTYMSGAAEEAEAGGLLDIIINVISTGLGTLPTKTYPSVSWATAGIQADVTAVTGDTTVIPAVLQYITNNYSGFVYDHAKCSRDVALIIDAARYDFCLDSNFASMVAAYSYLRLPANKVKGEQKDATIAAYEYARQLFVAEISDATAIAGVNYTFELVNDILFGGAAEGSNDPVDDFNVYAAIRQLELNKDFIVAEVSAWMNYNYVDFDSYYTSATCERDIGMIVDAASYDLITGSNFASSVAGMAYYRVQSANVTGGQLLQTVAAIKHAKVLSMDYVDSSHRAAIAASFDNVISILEGGLDVVPAYTWPDNGTSDATSVADAAALQTNRTTMVSGVTTYLSTTAPYDAVWAGLSAAQKLQCERDTGYIIDAMTYDVQYGGNYQTVIAGDAYYSFGTLQIAGGEKAATIAAYTQLGTLAKAYTSATGDTAIDNLVTDLNNIINNGAGTVSTTYPSETGEDATTQTSFTDLQTDKSTIQSAVTTYITNTFSSYTYNTTLCERDVATFIDAMKWDLQWAQEYRRSYTNGVTLILPSNYKTRLAARYYVNAVLGSQEEDFFYLRNGTGLRMMTMDGLNGDLTPENELGTSRVTAGAYTSLDPGWGPNDERVWITARSPYVQNCSTFGNAATGQRIDGALHNGGYDSMVSNDFTQVISDGIGAHILNNGRAELVSVFTYYSYIGYLAESGGRIRATNGNNSYGVFGSVAEGVDPDETPVTAIVDNKRQYKATISAVNTDQNELINVEFGHAGNDYTEANISVFGPGDNEEIFTDEFRDDAVYQVRLLDLDDSSGDIGGSGYTIVSNTAQSGTSTEITISATDSASSTAYIGMKIIITAGNGTGQYGLIDTYNSGTKVATVVKESTGVAGWDHLIPGTTIVNPDATSVYQIEPAISFSAPPSSNTAHTMPAGNTWNDIHWFETSELFTAVTGTTSGDGISASFDVERVYSKYFITINVAGTGYSRLDTITIPGTSVGGLSPANDITITLTTVNSATGAIIEFDFDGEARGGTFVAISNTTANAYSYDGETWSASTMPNPGAGATWHRLDDGLVDDGSSTYRASYAVAVTDGSNNVAYTETGTSWSSTTLPVGMSAAGAKYVAYALLGPGTGRFVVLSDDDTDIAYSDDGGANWVYEAGVLPGTGYAHLIYGKGKFVAIDNAGNAVYSTNGIDWSAGSGLPSLTYTDVAYGANKFIAVASNNNQGAYSLDGINWTVFSLPAIASPTAYTKVEYGQGVFVATQTSTGSTVVKSEDGLYWQQVNVTADPGTPSGHGAIAFGNPARAGMFALTSAGASKTHVIKLKQGCRAKGRPSIASEKIYEIRLVEPGSGYYSGAPTMTVTDPNNIYDIITSVRIGKGALGNPSFSARGNGFISASADIDTIGSDGYADFYQDGQYVAVRRLTSKPVPGSNVVFDSLPDTVYKLVNVVSFVGTQDGSYTAFLQLSPDMEVIDAPEDGDGVTMRIRYSQVRLTGHDFLDVGTGGFETTNYPGIPLIEANQENETVDLNGGRVFYTATDQDGNFRVGDLFTIEQSTGIATLNAEAFNIAGLQELTLGEVTLGGNSASITEFSTDPFFTANSDTIVPTQRAIKAYIEAQIGGGGASLNVNSVTAGDVFIGTNVITNVAGGVINIQGTINFTGGVIGVPVAYNYFLR